MPAPGDPAQEARKLRMSVLSYIPQSDIQATVQQDVPRERVVFRAASA
jgi:hypothetical protein